jgi:hypothetical protein
MRGSVKLNYCISPMNQKKCAACHVGGFCFVPLHDHPADVAYKQG